MRRKANLRAIPSVDRVVNDLGEVGLPRATLVALVRRELARIRKSGDTDGALDRVRSAALELERARIQPVINGTGVIVHTNFGRAPLADAAIRAMGEIAGSYNNLEFDLSTGARGGRAVYLEHNLAVLCGAEAATVVNNCAAALVLVLRHFASKDLKREVIISRGQLVQIGGGFRIPEILEASGAVLREVGTTNKTALGDYRRAIGKSTALILKVHQSNFFMDGFVESPPTAEISAIAHKARVPFVEDLGSGAVFATESITPGAEHEPTPAEVLKQGVDLVTFSGDKLLGGPQAGIIAGRTKHVAELKGDPFFRALRCDKLILSALESTVDLHLRGEANEIPILTMMRASVDALRERGSKLLDQLRALPVEAMLGACKSQMGGGSLPRTQIPSIALELQPQNASPQELANRLRAGSPAVVGMISGRRLKLDLRTIVPSQGPQLIACIRRALQ